MVRLRQSYLGSSPQRTLFIVPRPPQRSQPLGKCFISSLPDELLAQILDHLAPPNLFYHGPEYEKYLPILIVCERWRRLYEPILYRGIDLGHAGWQKPRRTARLVKTFEDRPGIPGHVREIHIQIYQPSDATCRMVVWVIQCCKSLRKLSLHMTMSSTVWPIIHTASKLPRLETLQLTGYEGGPALQMILTHFDLPTLKELHLSRYGLSVDNGPKAPWRSVAGSTPPSLDHIFSHHSCNGAVTALSLTDPSAPPDITKSLLQWPAHLTSLSIDFLAHSIYALMYTVGAMQQLLDTQCESLQHVVIGIIPGQPRNIPNFCHFQRLQTLQLSKYNLLTETPHEAAVKLSPPMLRQLAISFSPEDQHQESPHDFLNDQIRWLENFASHVTVNRTANCRLDTVFVDFNPDTGRGISDEPEHMIWPWEYLEKAVQALSRYSVTMTYSTPEYTKQEWSDMLLERQRERDTANDPERVESDVPTDSSGDSAW